MNEDTYRSS